MVADCAGRLQRAIATSGAPLTSRYWPPAQTKFLRKTVAHTLERMWITKPILRRDPLVMVRNFCPRDRLRAPRRRKTPLRVLPMPALRPLLLHSAAAEIGAHSA